VTHLRIGTRGSALARIQTQWVCDRLMESGAPIEFEMVVIRSEGDVRKDDLPTKPGWPADAFTGALERALLDGRIDVAVHSHKDLPTTSTPGLIIAAIPKREAPHDVLIPRTATTLDRLPADARIGTSSPRRTAQLLQVKPFNVQPIRGNVPTRIEALECGDYDAIVLAAAGLNRLNIGHPHAIDLPVDQFIPAPAQGALAVQTRDERRIIQLVSTIDDATARQQVTAERALLAAVSAGCQTAVGALASVFDDTITLAAQLFSDDYHQMVGETMSGTDPIELGTRLGRELKSRLNQSC